MIIQDFKFNTFPTQEISLKNPQYFQIFQDHRN